MEWSSLPLVLLLLWLNGSLADNTTIDGRAYLPLIPLQWARRIHSVDLPDLLSTVHGVSRHPAFVSFIREGNTTARPPLLGASRPPSPHRGGVNDLKEVATERRAVIKDAVCKPRKQPVMVPRPRDPLVIYTPPCVMLPRCSGCCSHELLECVPTKVVNVRKKVLALRFSAEDRVTLADDASSVKRVRMKKHAKCECQCKVKSSDCTPRQTYDAANCRCACPNERESTSCPGTKIWSSEDCACKCAEVTECSTGLEFDPVQCRCLPSSRGGQTLLFRTETATPAPPQSSHGGWGTGVSSGVIVDPPAPRPAYSNRARQPSQASWTTRRPPPQQQQTRREQQQMQRQQQQIRREQQQMQRRQQQQEWQQRQLQQREWWRHVEAERRSRQR